jgi:hypothetical protein
VGKGIQLGVSHFQFDGVPAQCRPGPHPLGDLPLGLFVQPYLLDSDCQ